MLNENVRILEYTGSAAPNNPKAYPLAMRDRRGYEVTPGKMAVLKKNVKK